MIYLTRSWMPCWYEMFLRLLKRISMILVLLKVSRLLQVTLYMYLLDIEAARTYFKTRKSAYQRKKTWKDTATATSTHRRQRKHNVCQIFMINFQSYHCILLQKAHGRLKALNMSTTLLQKKKKGLDMCWKLSICHLTSQMRNLKDPTKQLIAVMMMIQTPILRSNDKERNLSVKLTWRSRELQLTLESLDRKLARRRTNKAKSMCLEVTYGTDSTRPAPENSPEWATELFSWHFSVQANELLFALICIPLISAMCQLKIRCHPTSWTTLVGTSKIVGAHHEENPP